MWKVDETYVLEATAEGLREAGLLWLVFSMLDRLLTGSLTLLWTAGNVGGAGLLWTVGTLVEARRRWVIGSPRSE